MASKKVIHVTTLDQLRSYKDGAIVELPPFAEGQPFMARVQRPSMMRMLETGQIPNELVVRANQLFLNGAEGFNPHQENVVKEIYPVLVNVAKACLIEPTYDQIVETGMELTDEQLMFLFSYMQEGVRTLESFRAKQENNISNCTG